MAQARALDHIGGGKSVVDVKFHSTTGGEPKPPFDLAICMFGKDAKRHSDALRISQNPCVI